MRNWRDCEERNSQTALGNALEVEAQNPKLKVQEKLQLASAKLQKLPLRAGPFEPMSELTVPRLRLRILKLEAFLEL